MVLAQFHIYQWAKHLTTIVPVCPTLTRKSFEEGTAERFLIAKAFRPFKVCVHSPSVSHVGSYDVRIKQGHPHIID